MGLLLLMGDSGSNLKNLLAANRTEYANERTSLSSANYRGRHYLRGSGPIRLIYQNEYGNTLGTDTTQFTVTAGIENASGTILQVLFSGNAAGVCAQGQTLISDPINISSIGISNGDFFYVRNFVTPSSGGSFPRGRARQFSAGEGGDSTANATDQSLSGTISTASVFLFGPVAIIAQRNRQDKCFTVFGDSISFGQGDANGDTTGGFGFAERAIGNTNAVANFSLSGFQLSQFNTYGPTIHDPFLAYSNVCILHFGRNDLTAVGDTGGTNISSFQSDFNSAVARIEAAGNSCVVCTIPPGTTSTDSWATTVNQTTLPGESKRLLINDWLINSSGFDYVCDTASSVETSGVWTPNFTSDGIHPVASGHIAMKDKLVADLTAWGFLS